MQISPAQEALHAQIRKGASLRFRESRNPECKGDFDVWRSGRRVDLAIGKTVLTVLRTLEREIAVVRRAVREAPYYPLRDRGRQPKRPKEPK
ncbi:MAG: hypothetical protein ABSH49_32875 [Bryobacteraceae bacterium]|jgi:hypothetical protein